MNEPFSKIFNHPKGVAGTGLYRTVFIVEALSDIPIADITLDDLAQMVVDGPISGQMEVLDWREISKEDMQEALKRQGSDPGFLDSSPDK